MNFESSKNKTLFKVVVISISLLLGLIIAFAEKKGFPGRLETMTTDSLYQSPDVIPYNIKIIAVDETTLQELGPYSDWNRDYFANLLNILYEDKDNSPKITAFDFMFSGTNYSESDHNLAEAAKNAGNVVTASAIDISSKLCTTEDGNHYISKYIAGESGPYDELASYCSYGFTNAIFDDDGYIRRMYTKIDNYESFAYVIASEMTSLPDFETIVEIKYTGLPGDFETIPMSKVLDGSVPGSYFSDAIVLVGAHEEGMMDAYSVPIDYSREMYGVELQANYINALVNNKIIKTINPIIQFLITTSLIFIFNMIAYNCRLRTQLLCLAGMVIIYPLTAFTVFNISSVKMGILAIPFGLFISFLLSLIYKYIQFQHRKAEEMQTMLFSMAEGFAEAIEGRTPYNANHTKNVAKRSVEMLEYINMLHRKKKSSHHFSKSDIKQLYLAAMLHDIGKMDVPLEIMDKPTKLGSRENTLRDRLTIISLKIQLDALNGHISQSEADEKCEKIKVFSDKLGLFNCGKPLNEEEWAIVNGIAESVYVDKDGNETPYLTNEEIDDLHIKAGTLSDNERKIMQSHVEYTDKILSHMNFGDSFKDVRRMASDHHELLNGRGYPRGVGEESLDTMTRILTIMDIYDSLIADDRPYKKPKPIPVAFDILDEECEAGKVDRELLDIAKEMYLKEYKKEDK